MPIKFSFSNDQESDLGGARQGYPLQNVERGHSAPLSAARYLQRVKIERVETNDHRVDLSKTMEKGGNSALLNLICAFGAAALAWNVIGPMVVFGMKVLLTLVCAFVGYMAFKGGLKPKGGGGDGQA